MLVRYTVILGNLFEHTRYCTGGIVRENMSGGEEKRGGDGTLAYLQ